MYRRAQLSVIATINQALSLRWKIQVVLALKVESSSFKENLFKFQFIAIVYFSRRLASAILDASDCGEKYKSGCRIRGNLSACRRRPEELK